MLYSELKLPGFVIKKGLKELKIGQHFTLLSVYSLANLESNSVESCDGSLQWYKKNYRPLFYHHYF